MTSTTTTTTTTTMTSSSNTTTNSSVILQPHMAAATRNKQNLIQVSLHTLPKPLIREFHHVFQENHLDFKKEEDEDNNDGDVTMMMDEDVPNQSHSQQSTTSSPLELLAIPTNQHALKDLVAVGDDIEEEKDRLLNCVRSTHPFHSSI